jgi:hypothetical protein
MRLLKLNKDRISVILSLLITATSRLCRRATKASETSSSRLFFRENWYPDKRVVHCLTRSARINAADDVCKRAV